MYKKLGVISLGCDKNRVDTEEMLYNLSGSVFSVTPDLNEAQIIIINTCAFIESARREAIDTILQAAQLKENGLEKLVVTGCLPQKYADELRADLPEVDCFLGIDSYSDIKKVILSLYDEQSDTDENANNSTTIHSTDSIASRSNNVASVVAKNSTNKQVGSSSGISNDSSTNIQVGGFTRISNDSSTNKQVGSSSGISNNGSTNKQVGSSSGISNNGSTNLQGDGLTNIQGDGSTSIQANNVINESKRVLTTPELYAYLKIADGCDNHCTFCTIPSIRGKYRSKPIEQLTDEVRALKRIHDTNEIILVAQDVTSYGKDLYNEYKLLSLIRSLSSLDIERIRLMYCYPELITKELIMEISTNPKVAKYIDIPLQHVDSGILKLMNRRSTYESICELIQLIRSIDPLIAIRTTFMVGFPSETDASFNTLYNFLEKYPLEHVGIFAYSTEEDTPSARLGGRVADKTKLERVNALGELHLKQVKNKNKALIGSKRKAIYFDIDYERNLFMARSQFDAPDIDSIIYFSSDKMVEFGTEYEITITAIDNYDLIGRL